MGMTTEQIIKQLSAAPVMNLIEAVYTMGAAHQETEYQLLLGCVSEGYLDEIKEINTELIDAVVVELEKRIQGGS